MSDFPAIVIAAALVALTAITNHHIDQTEATLLKAIDLKFVVTSPTITSYSDAIVYRKYDTSQFINEEETDGTSSNK